MLLYIYIIPTSTLITRWRFDSLAEPKGLAARAIATAVENNRPYFVTYFLLEALVGADEGTYLLQYSTKTPAVADRLRLLGDENLQQMRPYVDELWVQSRGGWEELKKQCVGIMMFIELARYVLYMAM